MTAAITGVGVVSAFGEGAQLLFDALSDGRSGIGRIGWFDASPFATQVAGEVPVGGPLDAAWLAARLAGDAGTRVIGELDRRGAVRDRKIAFALLAAAEAWLNAGCTADDRGASLVVGLGLDGEPRDLAARAVHDLLGLRGPVIVHASAGALAVAHAASLIERGVAELVVCGAADSRVDPLGLAGVARLGALSPRSELDACRPFDRDRDGFVLGEGAAMFVVEDARRARARGAQVLAQVAGWASTHDAYHPTSRRPDGIAAGIAMQRALIRAGLPPEAIGYVAAHGSGAPLEDPAECIALHGALGPHAERVPVSSIKGAVGHLMAASGALELAASLVVFERDLLPGTANHRERDPACRVDVIAEPRTGAVDALMASSFGPGGQNCAVVLTR